MTDLEKLREQLEKHKLQMDRFMLSIGLLRECGEVLGVDLNIPKDIPDNTFAICTPGKEGIQLWYKGKWVNLIDIKEISNETTENTTSKV